MPRVITWLVMMTVDALPQDEDQLLRDLPATAQIHVGNTRTGIILKIDALSLTNAQQRALRTVVDLLPNLCNAPVTTMQTCTAAHYETVVGDTGPEPFLSLLFGPGSTPLVPSAATS